MKPMEDVLDYKGIAYPAAIMEEYGAEPEK